jgi:glucose-1-phosphate thymidylyltransferase
MLTGLRDVLLITTPHDQDAFHRLLGNGEQLGMNISFVIQEQPNGLAEALILGEKFLDGDKCALILGDNLFYGPGLGTHLQQNTNVDGALIFAYQVSDPSAYGVVEFGIDGKVISIEEKPAKPKRGELEITALNNLYLEMGELHAEILSRATTWLDTGTHESLYEAGGLIRTLQSRTGLRIGDVEQISHDQGWI